MIFLGITILGIIVGIFGVIIGLQSGYDREGLCLLGICCLVLSTIFILVEMVLILNKPFEYKTFKVKYDTIKETITFKDDIRDATFTNQIIEINSKIRSCNEFKDSYWVGIFQNKRICELPLLNKGGELIE